MAKPGEIDVNWGDDTHKFRLAIGQLRELQDKTGCGPMELLRRITGGIWKVDELRETVRLGLIGGGMKPVDALALVRRYVDDRPLTENVTLCQAMLMVILFGNQDDQPGEPDRRGSESGRMDGSPTPESTARVQ